MGGRDGRTQLGQLAGPDVGVPPLVRRDPAEGVRPGLVLLDLGERVVQDDRVTFELEILEAGREVDGRHAAHRTRVRVLAAYVAPVSHDAGPPPRLAVHEACRHQVSLGGRCDRGDAPDRGAPGPGRADHDRARRGRGAAAQDRRPSAPSRLLRACDAGGPAGPGWQRPARDEVGGGVPGESGGRAARDPRGRGPQRSGDRAYREPSSTAARSPRSGRRRSRAWRCRASAPQQLGRAPSPRAAIIGAGVQGHSHLEVLGHVLPGVELAIHDRHQDRAEALAEAARATPGIAAAEHGRRRRATRSPMPTS